MVPDNIKAKEYQVKLKAMCVRLILKWMVEELGALKQAFWSHLAEGCLFEAIQVIYDGCNCKSNTHGL